MIMDVYVFTRAKRDNLNMLYVTEVLKKLELLKFAERITDLVYNWFSGDTPDTDSLIADFILCNRTFGSSENAILQSSLRQDKKSGRKHSGLYRIIRHIFPGYSFISSRFPTAKKFKVLYPYYVLKYWFLRIFRNRNINTTNIKKYLKSTDSDSAKRLLAVMKDLGLDSRM